MWCRMPPKKQANHKCAFLRQAYEVNIEKERKRKEAEAESVAKKDKNIKEANARRLSTPSLQKGLSAYLSKTNSN